jgi:prevent-host-death family protein
MPKTIEVVGAFEAKTHLSELLRKVASGQTIRISQRGRPVADLVPIQKNTVLDSSKAAAKMRTIHQKATKLQGVSIKELIEFGRS